MRALPSPLLVVTDRHGHKRPLAETVQAVLDGGGRWIWFREKDFCSGDDRRALAIPVAARVGKVDGVLSIGGDPHLAAELGCGVHLGGGTRSAAIAAARVSIAAAGLVGVSAHTLGDVEQAAEGKADYVTLSPIFLTASKPGYGPALGLDAIARATRIGLPVIALGGVDAGTALACRRAGAAGIAVMGAPMRADDPAVATRALLAAWATGMPATPHSASP